MEALRYIQKVTSDSLVVPNVGRYKGKNVEVIILPLETDNHEIGARPGKARGMLKRYASPELLDAEKTAWENAMREKHGNS